MIRNTKYLKVFYLIPFVIVMMLWTLQGCSGRKSIPVVDKDSTLVFPAKKADDIAARITMCRKLNKKTGEPVDAGIVFSIGEKEMVRAYIQLENQSFHIDKDLMFHLEWIGPDKSCFYMKRIDLLPGDTADFLYSSISVAPGTREPGPYQLKLYYFRELIGVKDFTLVTDSIMVHAMADSIKSDLSLHRIAGKKSLKQAKPDTVFETGEKAKLRAVFDIKNNGLNSNQAQTFFFEWVNPEGESFYKKQVDLLPDDTAQSISSSVSLSPESRQFGKYAVRVFLSDYLLNEKSFELIPENKAPKPELGHIDVSIMLGKSIDKKTRVLKGMDSVFVIGDKARIFAVAELTKVPAERDQNLEFVFDWTDKDGKSFFKKQVDLLPGDTLKTISSSVSITPDKRQAGDYQVKLFLFDDLLGIKKFRLNPEK